MLDEADAVERRKALSAVKVQVGNSARFVGQQAIQLHGGIGVTEEYAVGHYFKRLTMIGARSATPHHHLAELRPRAADSSRAAAQRHELRSRDPADAAFRDEVRAFLREHCRPRWRGATLRGFHPTQGRHARVDAHPARARAGRRRIGRCEHGGTGWSPLRRHLFEEECFLGRRAARPAPPLQPGRAGDLHLRQRRAEASGICRRSCAASSSGPGLLGAERRLRPGVAAHARGARRRRTTSSTARRPGPPKRTTPTCCSAWCAPTRTRKPQRGISFLLIDAKRPASRSARSSRSTARTA